MSVGVLLITHGKLGRFLVETAAEMMGPLRLDTEVLEVRRVQDTEVLLRQGQRMLQRLDSGDGVLMLTDAYGSTPANIACRLGRAPRTRLVAGMNLPMVLRVFNYPRLDVDALARAAVEGGQRGVTLCPPVPEDQQAAKETGHGT